MQVQRRAVLKAGLAVGAAGALRGVGFAMGGSSGPRASTIAPFESTIFDPVRDAFQRPLPVPAVLQESAQGFTPGDAFHGIAPEFDPDHPDHDPDWNDAALKLYEVDIEQTTQQIVPGVDTPVFSYRDGNNAPGSGGSPGPTILARFNEPSVIRFRNRLTADSNVTGNDVEGSTHQHGGHNPAHADGFPNFYVLAGFDRDYYYPNIVPKRVINGELQFDRTVIPSTTWYHDHAMDITGFNVAHGLAGYYLVLDDLEEGLIEDGVLPDARKLATDPDNAFEIPIVVADQQLNADGTIRYDFFDHNGRLGDIPVANGIAQPFVKVQPRKYRLRILNGANARVFQLRLSSGQPFLQIGADSWLLPRAIPVDDFQLGNGERADMIVDFSHSPEEVFLENIMVQDDGRGPRGVDPERENTKLVKFIVEGRRPLTDVSVAPGTPLRPHDPIRPEDITVTRTVSIVRRNGAWQINNRFFSPRRGDAVPEIDPDGINAERWILDNNSGGWWHPMHFHLEHHELQVLDGQAPIPTRSFKTDLTLLPAGTVAEVFVRFRTFTGPFAFHCHNIEHEDMRMMQTLDPRHPGEDTILNGVDAVDPAISGVPQTCEELEPVLLFDAAGDVDRLEGRGVGFPCDDFEP